MAICQGLATTAAVAFANAWGRRGLLPTRSSNAPSASAWSAAELIPCPYRGLKLATASPTTTRPGGRRAARSQCWRRLKGKRELAGSPSQSLASRSLIARSGNVRANVRTPSRVRVAASPKYPPRTKCQRSPSAGSATPMRANAAAFWTTANNAPPRSSACRRTVTVVYVTLTRPGWWPGASCRGHGSSAGSVGRGTLA